MSVLSLFSGIGGIDLGLESTGGFRTVAFCEVDSFCRLVLAKHWPEVPIHDDVRRLTVESLGGLRPDVIAGGFPCQPHSVAGRRKGVEDERHLWPEFARLVREFRPRWVLGENVPGIRSTAADLVLSDLEAAGYTCWPLVVGADDVGAPHRRKRVWFVAHRRGERRGDGGLAGREERHAATVTGEPEGGHAAFAATSRWPARPGEPQHEWEEPRLARFGLEDSGQVYAVSGIGTSGGVPERGLSAAGRLTAGRSTTGEPADAVGGVCGSTRRPELPVGTPVDGLPLDMVRLARRANREALKAAGNSVCPQVVQAIGRAILAAEEELSR